ncbi:MAG TPA: LacI family DNA-binding transcriptional regulator [Chloroflexota bacterium]|nr:LacI family DNA-binding transcriptional regulator [Chloroflexota bacterium]
MENGYQATLKRTRARPGGAEGGGRTREARIADVALRAGVSVATVSRVLSPSGHRVRAETQERVRLAAAALNFVPSPVARALATGAPAPDAGRIVGVLAGGSDHPHLAGMLRGAEEVGRRTGYLLFVGHTEQHPEREVAYARYLRLSRAGGLLLLGAPGGGQEDDPAWASAALAAEVAAFQGDGGAVVAISQHHLPVPRVVVDSAGAAHLALSHLLDLGHQRIGIVAGPAALVVSQLQAAGVRRALSERFLRADPGLVASSDLTMEGGEGAAGRLLDRPRAERPTAIFAATDLLATGVLRAARQRGLSVPGDLSVVGLGDSALAEGVSPALTTVRLPLRELGALAMETLLAVLRSGPAAVPTEASLPATLEVRHSTAPPPAGKGKRKKGKKGKEERAGRAPKERKEEGGDAPADGAMLPAAESERLADGDRERTSGRGFGGPAPNERLPPLGDPGPGQQEHMG